MWFFYLYLFAILILGGFNIGPFSIRVYMTVIMAGYLLFIGNTTTNRMPRWLIKGYVVFLVLTGFTLLLNGEYFECNFNKNLLSAYLVCFVTFFAIDRFVNDNDDLQKVIRFLLCIMLINYLVSILQFVGHPSGKMIALLFANNAGARENLMNDEDIDFSDYFGAGLPVGLFSYVFANALCSSIIGIYSVWGLLDSRKTLFKIFNLAVFMLSIIVGFMLQERATLILLLLVSIFVIFRYFNNKKQEIRACFFGVFIIVLFLSLCHGDYDLGRFSNISMKEDVRGAMWGDVLDFVIENLFLGGPILYSETFPIAPHNFFLNALIYGGLFGGICAIYLYVRMTLYALRRFFNKKTPLLIVVLAGSVIIYSINCLFHNASIIYGDTMIFITFPLLLKASTIHENTMLHR